MAKPCMRAGARSGCRINICISFSCWAGSNGWFLCVGGLTQSQNECGGSLCPLHPLTTMCQWVLSLLAAVLGDSLSAKTVCASAKQKASVHYNLHNLYGLMEAKATARYFLLAWGWDGTKPCCSGLGRERMGV